MKGPWVAYWGNMMKPKRKNGQFIISTRSSLILKQDIRQWRRFDASWPGLLKYCDCICCIIPHGWSQRQIPSSTSLKKSSLSRRVARWQVQLSEYSIQYISQKAIKGSVIADFLAERASEDYEPINFDFLNEDLMVFSHDEKERSEKNC